VKTLTEGNNTGYFECQEGDPEYHCKMNAGPNTEGMPGTGARPWNCENPACFAEKWSETEMTCVPNSCIYSEIVPPPLSRSEREFAGCVKGGTVASGEICTYKYTGNTGPLGEEGFECGIAECYAGIWNHYQFGCYPIKCHFKDITQPAGTIAFGDGCLPGESVSDGASCSFFKSGGNKYQEIICLAGVWSTKTPSIEVDMEATGDQGHSQDYTGLFISAGAGGLVAAVLLGGAIAFLVLDCQSNGGKADNVDLHHGYDDDATSGVEMSVNPTFEDELDLAEPGVGDNPSAPSEGPGVVDLTNEDDLDMAEPGVAAEPVEASI